MNLNKILKSILIIMISCLTFLHASKYIEAVEYAYLLNDCKVFTRKGKRVAEFSQGMTIKITAAGNKKVWTDYKGKRCWISNKNIVTGDELIDFIKNNQRRFNSIVEVQKKTKIFKESDGSSILRTVRKGVQFRLFAETATHYKIQLDGVSGWLLKSDCKRKCIVDVMVFPKPKGTTKREQIVNYAKQFLGNPYVWGGTSLTSGCDCSGYVQSVFKYFGYSLPRCSYQQATVGEEISFSKMKPGDLIFYYRGSNIGHVTIYIGNGKCIQARGAKYGIVITDYDYSSPAFARRVL